MIEGYPLRDLNTWGVDGHCSAFAAPETAGEASLLLERCVSEKKDFYILGGGSNVLVQDGLLDALVIHTVKMDSLSIEDGGDKVRLQIGAGYSVRKLLAWAVESDWGGLEFLVGIPGTLGGALWGNAGAAGTGFADLIESIDTLEPSGPRTWKNEELCWQYRQCPLNRKVSRMITGATLILKRSQPETIHEKLRLFSDLRKGQPHGAKTAGCVFKNPVGASAGRLIDQAGCKGMRVGGATVSEKHANFIENIGNASAQDIYTLGETCRERVFEQSGTELEYEVQFFGTFKKTRQ